MKRVLLALFAFVVAAPLLFASQEVDDLVMRLMEKRKIPGLALLVSRDGKPVLAKGYGYANVEHMVPVKPETIFQSGSVGKQFTATAVMMLVEEGKIGLNDPISKYVPKSPKRWKEITVRHLLTHTSGLGDYPKDFDYRADYTEEKILEIIKEQALLFSPGEKWEYSNLGYVLLGILIHKVSGKFYGDFLQERVFQPLEMTTTRIINEADIIANRAAGYELQKDKLRNQDWVSPTVNTTADGSLYFSILDLAKWDAALYSERLLKKSSLDQMWTPVKLQNGKSEPYGFGWRIGAQNGHTLIEHSGSWQGFNTHIARYVDDRLTVVVLINLAGGNPTYIAHAVAGLLDPSLALPQRTRIQLPQDELMRNAGEYKFDDGTVLKISVVEDRLKASYEESSQELLPESANSFFIEDSETTVRFEQNEKGETTGLIRLSGQTPMEQQAAKKIR